jgi:hypothetical protein
MKILLLKMKYRITPLIIVSLGLILFAIYLLISGRGGNLGPLVGIVSIIAGILCLLPYFLFRKVFKLNIGRQIVTELFLIIIVAFIYYRVNEKVILHLPRNFQGHILVVYGVDNNPKLQTKNIFNPNIDVDVPESGIILTSTKYAKSIVIIDSSDGDVKLLRPGYGFPFSNDTLRCGKAKYNLDIIVFGKLPLGWSPIADTANRNFKKKLACKILSE